MSLLEDTVHKITKVDGSLGVETKRRLDNLTKPLGSLGRLEDFALLIMGSPKKESALTLKKLPPKWFIIFFVAARELMYWPGMWAPRW